MTCIRGDTAATLRRVSSTRPRCRVCVACRYPGGSHHRQNNRESVPNIILNNTINLFFFNRNQHFAISNRKSLRVLFDKIASVHFIRKIYLYSSTGNGQPREPALCQLYRRTLVPYRGCSHHRQMPIRPAQLKPDLPGLAISSSVGCRVDRLFSRIANPTKRRRPRYT